MLLTHIQNSAMQVLHGFPLYWPPLHPTSQLQVKRVKLREATVLASSSIQGHGVYLFFLKASR